MKLTRSAKRPRPTTDSGEGDHCVDGVRHPIEGKYGQRDAKEPEVANDEMLRYKISAPKDIKTNVILSELSHWEPEGKSWLRSDERKASDLGKKKGASLLTSPDTISCFWYNGRHVAGHTASGIVTVRSQPGSRRGVSSEVMQI